ncbi:MAG TPA: hypothetical protein VFD77_06630, partial [Brumimicrobium sp.]|nr:hypothetical protein [Brumimicrobium sp.]
MTRIVTLLGFFIPVLLMGQNSYYLSIVTQENTDFDHKKNLNFDSKQDIYDYLIKTKSKAIKKGFVLASIDSIEWKNDTAYVDFYWGDKFEQISISFDQEDAYLISKTPRMSERMISQLPFKPHLVEDLLRGVNKYLNQNGYPFSRVFLKVDTIQPGISKAHLNIEKG